MNGDKSCVEILLQYGADPDAADGDGKAPLMLAKEYGFIDIADLLKKSMLDKHKRELESKGVINWTANDVSEWVEAIGYPQYRNQSLHHHTRDLTLVFLRYSEPTTNIWSVQSLPGHNFTRHHITGRLLLQKLDMEVLKKELGIASYGARAQILERVQKVPKQKENSSNSMNTTIRSRCPLTLFFLYSLWALSSHKIIIIAFDISSTIDIGDKIVTIESSELKFFETLGKGVCSQQLVLIFSMLTLHQSRLLRGGETSIVERNRRCSQTYL